MRNLGSVLNFIRKGHEGCKLGAWAQPPGTTKDLVKGRVWDRRGLRTCWWVGCGGLEREKTEVREGGLGCGCSWSWDWGTCFGSCIKELGPPWAEDGFPHLGVLPICCNISQGDL